MTTYFGAGWASPVVSKRWAFAASVTAAFMRATRYRLAGRAAHRAWERAVGVAKL